MENHTEIITNKKSKQRDSYSLTSSSLESSSLAFLIVPVNPSRLPALPFVNVHIKLDFNLYELKDIDMVEQRVSLSSKGKRILYSHFFLSVSTTFIKP